MSDGIAVVLAAVARDLPDADPAELRGALLGQLERCAAAWPALPAPDGETARRWVDRARAQAGGGGSAAAAVTAALAELRGEDVHVADLCARGDAAALRTFEERFLAGIGAVLGRVKPDAAFLDEVRQIVREKLLVAPPGGTPRLLELAGQGDLGGLVRVVAIRTALNLRRDQHGDRRVSDDGMLDVLVAADEPAHLAADRARVKLAFQAALERLDARDRNVLRMHLVYGLGIDDIGRAHQVHRATAARWLGHIRDRLYRDTCDQLGAAGLTPEECESALKLVDSRLEISFERLLGTAGQTAG